MVFCCSPSRSLGEISSMMVPRGPWHTFTIRFDCRAIQIPPLLSCSCRTSKTLYNEGNGTAFSRKKNAGSVDRFSWPSFEKVPQQALLRPSKHFWQHRSTNLHFSCAPCKMTSNDQQPYLYAYSFVVVFSLSIRYLPKKYMTWTKKACLDQSIFHQLPFNRIFNPPGAPTT